MMAAILLSAMRHRIFQPQSTIAFLISAIVLAMIGFSTVVLLPILSTGWHAADATVVEGDTPPS